MAVVWTVGIFGFIACCIAFIQAPTPVPSPTVRLYRAFDVPPSAELVSKLECLRKHYPTIFVEIFNKDGPNKEAIIVVPAAANVNKFNVGCIIAPDLKKLTQFYKPENLFYAFGFVGAVVSAFVASQCSLWINTTSTDVWNLGKAGNVGVFTGLGWAFKILQALGFSKVGIYTSYYDAVELFPEAYVDGSSKLPDINGLLMYYFPTGTGRENQTAADMRDYVSFLGIKKPSVKQFAREITVCETTINDNVYVGRPQD